MKPHYFIDSCQGHLHDTREPNWASKPIRRNYRMAHREIRTVADFKATLRHGPYAWPGGYPLYLLCADGGALHFKCARENAKRIIAAIADRPKGYRDQQWECVACDVNYEDNELTCDQCGTRIESAYGED
jgi:hypothetical protein